MHVDADTRLLACTSVCMSGCVCAFVIACACVRVCVCVCVLCVVVVVVVLLFVCFFSMKQNGSSFHQVSVVVLL